MRAFFKETWYVWVIGIIVTICCALLLSFGSSNIDEDDVRPYTKVLCIEGYSYVTVKAPYQFGMTPFFDDQGRPQKCEESK
jgi:hypothetical protein